MQSSFVLCVGTADVDDIMAVLLLLLLLNHNQPKYYYLQKKALKWISAHSLSHLINWMCLCSYLGSRAVLDSHMPIFVFWTHLFAFPFHNCPNVFKLSCRSTSLVLANDNNNNADDDDDDRKNCLHTNICHRTDNKMNFKYATQLIRRCNQRSASVKQRPTNLRK